MRALFLALLSLCVSFAHADRFDDFIQAKMQEEKIPGLQFVVVYKGKVAMSRSYGVADAGKKTPVTKDTRFEIASVSKPFIATAVMMLWEQGKVKLEDPVGKYISDMPLAWSSVPVWNLLSHTSGIPEYRAGLLFATHKLDDTPFSQIVKNMPTDKQFDADDHFSYSNTNYLLLGKLIEGVAGKPYTEFLQKEIFDPLGMTSTGFIGKMDHAQGYAAWRSAFVPDPGSSFSWSGPGGSIVSTAEDLAKFDAALRTQRLIKNATLMRMLEPTSTKLGTMDYGFGWQTEKVGKTTMALHAGEMNGFSSMFLRLIDEQISVILLTNSSAIDGNTITRGILGLYFPEMDPMKLTPTVDESPEITRAHQRILVGIIAGHPDMDAFSDDYKAHVSEEKLLAVGSELRRGGRIRPLQVVRRYRKGQYDAHAYLLTQGQTQLLVTFLVDEKGKIAGLTVTAP
ncbi:MAG TPA: serine hydrolase domain-containing protein [Fimbriimonadaceae bacterium]|nr:serine hydrolase domain-containing protein [Fimbriimonadaceae bacterium]